MLLDGGPLTWQGNNLLLGSICIVKINTGRRWFNIKWPNGKESRHMRTEIPDERLARRFVIAQLKDSAANIKDHMQRAAVIRKLQDCLEQESSDATTL